jgi:hypothetical protein
MKPPLRFVFALVAGLAGLLLGPLAPAAAQGPTPPPFTPPPGIVQPGVLQLRVQIMPEFDDPRVLIIVQGTLDAGAQLPASMTFRLPSDASINQMAVIDPAVGVPQLQTYDSKPDPAHPEWMLVTYTLTSSHFFYEYYYNPIVGAPDKQIDFKFNSVQPVGALLLEAQQPRTASNFTMEPAAQATNVDQWGLTEHQLTGGALAANTDFTWKIRYTKTGSDTSVTREQGQGGNPSTGGQPSTTGDTPAAAFNSWTLPIVLLAAGLVVAGVLGYFWPALRAGRRGARSAAKARRDVKSPGLTPPPQPATGGGFCYRCGKALVEEAEFCHACGAPVRRDRSP